MSFMRPFFGQIFGYGTLRVESAGQKQDLERIEYLPRPEEVFLAISELIFGDKKQPRSPMLEPPGVSGRGRWRIGRGAGQLRPPPLQPDAELVSGCRGAGRQRWGTPTGL